MVEGQKKPSRRSKKRTSKKRSKSKKSGTTPKKCFPEKQTNVTCLTMQHIFHHSCWASISQLMEVLTIAMPLCPSITPTEPTREKSNRIQEVSGCHRESEIGFDTLQIKDLRFKLAQSKNE